MSEYVEKREKLRREKASEDVREQQTEGARPRDGSRPVSGATGKVGERRKVGCKGVETEIVKEKGNIEGFHRLFSVKPKM